MEIKRRIEPLLLAAIHYLLRRNSMAKRFAGKVVAITGGNSGIGLATAKLFREEGARVAIAGRDQKTLDEAAKAIGGDTLAVKADVSKLERHRQVLQPGLRKVRQDRRPLCQCRHRQVRAGRRQQRTDVRRNLRHKCERPVFHPPEVASPSERQRRNRFEFLGCRIRREVPAPVFIRQPRPPCVHWRVPSRRS